jgi:hypothetical protein
MIGQLSLSFANFRKYDVQETLINSKTKEIDVDSKGKILKLFSRLKVHFLATIYLYSRFSYYFLLHSLLSS